MRFTEHQRSEKQARVRSPSDLYLEFILGIQHFALPIGRIKEAIQMVSISRLPKGSPDFVDGVINFRGNVIMVINPRTLLGLESVPYTLEMILLIVRMRFNPIALVVDKVVDLVSLPDHILEKPDSFEVGFMAAYLKGIAKHNGRLLYVLDVFQMFTPEQRHFIEKQDRDEQAT